MKSDGSFSLGGECWPGLGKVVEETAELNVELGKIIATHGDVKYWGGRCLYDGLKKELADSLAAIGFFIIANFSIEDIQEIDERVSMKFLTFQEWHRTKDG